MLYTIKPITWILYHRISIPPNLSLSLSLWPRKIQNTDRAYTFIYYKSVRVVKWLIWIPLLYTHPTLINKIKRYSCTSQKVVRIEYLYKDVRMELDIASYMSLSVSFFNQHCHLIHCIGLGKSVHSFLHSSLQTQHPPPLKYLKQRRY